MVDERMSYIIRPIQKMDGSRWPPQSSQTPAPAKGTRELYDALREAAPLTLPEAASVIAGWMPGNLETTDDPALHELHRSLLNKLQADAEYRRISHRPTAIEAAVWAIKAGIVIPPDLARLARSIRESSATDRSSSSESTRLQAAAELFAHALKKNGKPALKKTVAHEMRARGLSDKSQRTLERILKQTW